MMRRRTAPNSDDAGVELTAFFVLILIDGFQRVVSHATCYFAHEITAGETVRHTRGSMIIFVTCIHLCAKEETIIHG